jgi:hypothetical protein
VTEVLGPLCVAPGSTRAVDALGAVEPVHRVAAVAGEVRIGKAIVNRVKGREP